MSNNPTINIKDYAKALITTISGITNAASPKDEIAELIRYARTEIDENEAQNPGFKNSATIAEIRQKLDQIEASLPKINEGSIKQINLAVRLGDKILKDTFYEKLSSVPPSELTFDNVKRALSQTNLDKLTKDIGDGKIPLDLTTYDTMIDVAIAKAVIRYEPERREINAKLQASLKTSDLSEKIRQQVEEAIKPKESREFSPAELKKVTAQAAEKKEQLEVA